VQADRPAFVRAACAKPVDKVGNCRSSFQSGGGTSVMCMAVLA
jgi:hypothetical protein